MRSLLQIFFLAISFAPLIANASCIPFDGERMKFAVSWEFINAGTATMVTQSSSDGYRIESNSKSNRIIDFFRKVRDSITSEGKCDGKAIQSTRLLIQQKEGKYKAHKETTFDYDNQQFVYALNGNPQMFAMDQARVNVLDAFFAVRQTPIEMGKTISVPVFDAGKNYEIEVHVLREEKDWAPWQKAVDVIVIEPKLKTEGIFSSKGKVQIWLTKKERIPLKMTAQIKLGHIIATLVEYTPPTIPFSATE